MTTFDINFIKPFIDGVINTFKVQCSMEITAGKPYLKGQHPAAKVDIAAVIGLTSGAMSASIALCFGKDCFLAVMEKMIGEKYTEINKELEDGVAELLNIVYGYTKTSLNEKNYAVEKAIPTVVKGDGVTIRHMTTGPIVVIPFETSAGLIIVEVAVNN